MKNKKISFIKFAYIDKGSFYTTFFLTLFSLLITTKIVAHNNFGYENLNIGVEDYIAAIFFAFLAWIVIPVGRWMNYTGRWK